MKKFIVLALVLSICSVGVFAQPTVNGNVSAIYKLQGDPMAMAANMGLIRLAIGVPVGDFVKFNMDLRNDGGGAIGNSLGWNQVYAVTDISGALGLEGVKINLTGGNFEYWISNWNATTITHRARMVETFAIGSGNTAVALDFAVDAAQVLTYVRFDGGNAEYKVGLRLGAVVPGLNAVVSYSANTYANGIPTPGSTTGADEDAQYFKAEAGYTMSVGDGMSLFVPVSFLADLEADTMAWGSGVKFTGMGVTAAVEVGSSNVEVDVLKTVDVNLAYDVMKYLQVYGKAFMNTAAGAVDFLEAVDLGVRWTVGANRIYAGYVVDVGTAQAIMVTDDDNAGRAGVTGGGLYLGWRVAF